MLDYTLDLPSTLPFIVAVANERFRGIPRSFRPVASGGILDRGPSTQNGAALTWMDVPERKLGWKW